MWKILTQREVENHEGERTIVIRRTKTIRRIKTSRTINKALVRNKLSVSNARVTIT
jgi:hypothetical protein